MDEPRRRFPGIWTILFRITISAVVVLAIVAVIQGWSSLGSQDGKIEGAAGTGKPPARYPGMDRDAVKAQDTSRLDFSNPHTVKITPNMVKNAGRLQKLVIISKLKETDSPEAAEALEKIVLETPEDAKPEDDVRAHAIGALVGMKTEKAWPNLLGLAAHSSPKVRELVATSLGYSERVEAEEQLKKMLEDASPEVAKKAQEALARREFSKKGK